MWPLRFGPHRKRGLRVMVLTILHASPKNGVEIMDVVEAMTRGWWRPSPGSVYPLLEQLENDGLVKKADGGRYGLTRKASEGLVSSFGPRFKRPHTVDSAMREMGGFVSYFEGLSRSGDPGVSSQLGGIKDLARRLSKIAGAQDAEES